MELTFFSSGKESESSFEFEFQPLKKLDEIHRFKVENGKLNLKVSY